MQACECLYPSIQQTFIGALSIPMLLDSAEERGVVRGSKGGSYIVVPPLLFCSSSSENKGAALKELTPQTKDAEKEYRVGVQHADTVANQKDSSHSFSFTHFSYSAQRGTEGKGKSSS